MELLKLNVVSIVVGSVLLEDHDHPYPDCELGHA